MSSPFPKALSIIPVVGPVLSEAASFGLGLASRGSPGAAPKAPLPTPGASSLSPTGGSQTVVLNRPRLGQPGYNSFALERLRG